jgi:hypothetical protein
MLPDCHKIFNSRTSKQFNNKARPFKIDFTGPGQIILFKTKFACWEAGDENVNCTKGNGNSLALNCGRI